ncbi:MAG TPA: acetate/propionate family kinase [Gaiellaceae bacterium]|nr:acetate/propionate family kinase [Gaiellaceae bacterium]
MDLRVLVVNAGSTSLKLSVVSRGDESEPVESFEAVPEVGAVGHRVVHGGERFREPTLIDDEVERELEALVALAPLHNAPALRALADARRALPSVPHVAVFDTSFHASMPAFASTYALPARLREQGIRRFGFHGLSVQWAAEQVTVPRLVVCHLGGGCSVTAVREGRSVDTTMGFTPLEGVPMTTRSGSIDPGALIHLLRGGMSPDELDRVLEHESGLAGLSGGTGDVRELEGSDDPSARVALDVYPYRIAGAVAAMAVALDGLDALVFTAGVGERSPRVRELVCSRLGFLGVELDAEQNRAAEADAELGAGPVRIVVVHAREDVVAARAVRALLARA